MAGSAPNAATAPKKEDIQVEELNKFETILMVDDDPITCFIQSNLIKDMGYKGHIQEAYHGEAALTYLKETFLVTPQIREGRTLILLDINMPFVDGFEFLDELISTPELSRKNMHIAILSTSLTKSDYERARNFPVDGFLIKPLTEQKLTDLVHSLAQA